MKKDLTTSELIFEHGKVPPQAIDIEEVVLGALMLDNCLDRIIDVVNASVFYRETHQLIFKAISRLHNDSEKVDILTVTHELKKTGELELVGGPYYIAQLTERVSSSANIEAHAKLIAQKFIQRELIRVSGETIKEAFEDTSDSLEIYNHAKSNFDTLDDYIIGQQKPKDWHEHLRIFNEETDKKIQLAKDGIPVGVSTGISFLDKLINGWQRGELIILASRPSMGKTALALFFSKVAAKNGFPVDLYSLEMSSERLVQRMVLGETKISSTSYDKGSLTPAEIGVLGKTVGEIANFPISINENNVIDVNRIKANSRINNTKGACELIVIDYLQLIEPEKGLSSREREVATISRKLKAFAKDLNVPIILLCQLSRKCEERSDKRPILSDLRESGAIEQDADIVLFPFRQYYYSKDEHDRGKIEIEIAKNRNGNTGVVYFKHNEDISNFFIEEEPF